MRCIVFDWYSYVTLISRALYWEVGFKATLLPGSLIDTMLCVIAAASTYLSHISWFIRLRTPQPLRRTLSSSENLDVMVSLLLAALIGEVLRQAGAICYPLPTPQVHGFGGNADHWR